MKLLAALVLVWVVILLLGASFDVLGSVIWIAVLITVAAGLWKYINRDKNPPTL